MKRVVQYIVALSFTVYFTAKADVPVFGNSTNNTSAFQVGIAGDNTFGAAIGFTPLENLSVTSVTLWISGYNGLSQYYSGPNGVVFTNQSYDISISDNSTVFGYNTPGGSLAVLNIPAPNDGSLAPFTFTVPSGSVELEANQEYWVFIYGITIPGSFLYLNHSSWVGGGTPTGDAVYDGSLSYANGGFGSSTAIPAFTINTVPEPGVMGFVSLAILFGIGRVVGKRIQNRTQHANHSFSV